MHTASRFFTNAFLTQEKILKGENVKRLLEREVNFIAGELFY